MKYGIIVHKETYNLGDDIQSYATRKLLPRVDYVIDREHTDTFRSREGEPVAVIMAGWWFWQKWNWPPSDCILPMSTSIHININDIYDRGCPIVDEWMTGPGGEWLKAQEPIGARDEATIRFLQEHNIKTYFSGCITLTLPKQKCTADRGKYIVLVDLNEKLKKKAKELAEQTGLRVVEVSQRHHYNDPDVSWEKREKYVEKILTLYQNASCVITRRLHVTLPCLAMEVPVLPIVDMDNPSNICRWHPYQQWTRCVTNQDFLDGNFEFDFKNPPPNKTDYKETREKLIASVQEFIRFAEEQDGKTVQELRRVSYTEEDLLRWQNRLMKEALEKWLHQCRGMVTKHKNALKKQKDVVKEKETEIRRLKEKLAEQGEGGSKDSETGEPGKEKRGFWQLFWK